MMTNDEFPGYRDARGRAIRPRAAGRNAVGPSALVLINQGLRFRLWFALAHIQRQYLERNALGQGLQYHLAAIIEADGIAVSVSVGAQLNEPHLLHRPEGMVPLHLLGNAVHPQARPRRD